MSPVSMWCECQRGLGDRVLAVPRSRWAPPSSTHLGDGPRAGDEPAADVVDHPVPGPQVVTEGVAQVVLRPYLRQHGHQPCKCTEMPRAVAGRGGVRPGLRCRSCLGSGVIAAAWPTVALLVVTRA